MGRPAATADARGTYRDMAACDGGLVASRAGPALRPQRELVEDARLARPVAASTRTGRPLERTTLPLHPLAACYKTNASTSTTQRPQQHHGHPATAHPGHGQ